MIRQYSTRAVVALTLLVMAPLVLAAGEAPDPGHDPAYSEETNTGPDIERLDALCASLTDDGLLVREEAAFALDKTDYAPAEDALLRGIQLLHDEHLRGAEDSERREFVEFLMAGALWSVRADEKSAQAIIALAQLHTGEDRYDLYSTMNTPDGLTFLPDDERMAFYLDYDFPRRLYPVDAMDNISFLGSDYGDPVFYNEAQQRFIEAHRDEVVAILRKRVKKNGDIAAALVLAELKDETIVPDLIRGFIEAGGFYGWESSQPDALAGNQFPAKACYEMALRHITGKPLEEIVHLSGEDIAMLEKRGEWADLHVLYRFAPDRAKAILTKRRQEKGKDLEIMLALRKFIEDGMTQNEIREMFGEPDEIFGRQWSYFLTAVTGYEIPMRFLFSEADSEGNRTLIGWQ